ncbi:MAG: hypothetical protein IIA92_09775, partial [Chloroflexi bacterium]|nr:hypothetical protein [Chloroflexota bacterium]
TKLVAAINAVAAVLNTKVGDSDNLAFRVFGGPCEGDNTELLVPFGQGNKAKVREALAGMRQQQASGNTTLFRGIQEATGDFNRFARYPDIKQGIIVITGGVDTCDREYLEHIKDRMEGLPVEARFWIITLDAPPEEAKRLQEVARMEGWQTRNVKSAAELNTTLAEATDDVVREFPTSMTATPPPTVAATPTAMPTAMPTAVSTPTATPPPAHTPTRPPMRLCKRIEIQESETVENPMAQPHVFTGIARIDGNTASEGTPITAWVDGYRAGSAVVNENRYVILVKQPEGKSFDGKKVFFKIGEVVADETGRWLLGGGDELNLSARSECKQNR